MLNDKTTEKIRDPFTKKGGKKRYRAGRGGAGRGGAVRAVAGRGGFVP